MVDGLLLVEAKIALEALLLVSDRGPQPRKFDEALTWRENDTKARELADAALTLIKAHIKTGGWLPIETAPKKPEKTK